jgi:hypothetical protein
MSSTSEPMDMSNEHRDTLLQILRHPTSHNVEWRAALSLLEAIGSVEQRPDGKYLVRLGAETEVFVRPKDKDIDTQQIVDLRRMLTGAGYSTMVEDLKPKGKDG